MGADDHDHDRAPERPLNRWDCPGIAIIARMEVDRTRVEALVQKVIEELLDHLDRRQDVQDVPLHQRGFGVMDEPPA